MRLASMLWIAVVLVAAPFPAGAQAVELELAKLFAPAGASFDRFGRSVALAGDALAVGAPGARTAYVFRGTGASWDLEQELPSPTGTFGIAVALDGVRMVVGDDVADSLSEHAFGAARVFVEDGGAWTEEAVLRPPDDAIHDHLAAAVALAGEPS